MGITPWAMDIQTCKVKLHFEKVQCNIRQSHHAENLAESSVPLLNKWSRSIIKKS